MARIQGNLYKASTLSTKGTWKFWYNSANSFLRVFFFSFWLRRRRRCGRHHTGGHIGRTNPIIYTGAQVKALTHLGIRLTRSGLISLAPSVGNAFCIEIQRSISHQLLYPKWSPTKILQPWLNKSRHLPGKTKKWSYGSNTRRTSPKEIQKMKGIVREEVTTKDLFLQMIGIQISFERWGRRWTSWGMLSKRRQSRLWTD